MVIINPMKCESCGEELQADEVLIGVNENTEMIRKCEHCGNEVKV